MHALALEDINAAGGVFGTDVVLIEGDSGDTTTDIANAEVDRLLAEGADAIIGAAPRPSPRLVIDKITGAGVIQFSPANTSPDFTTYDDNGLYFRTAPSDLLQGKVLADAGARAGQRDRSVLFRQESTARVWPMPSRRTSRLPVAVSIEFTALRQSTSRASTPRSTPSWPPVRRRRRDRLRRVGQHLTTMHERGIGPTVDKNVWGVDGNDGSTVRWPILDHRWLKAADAIRRPWLHLRLHRAPRERYEGGVDGVPMARRPTTRSSSLHSLAARGRRGRVPAIAAEINGVTSGGRQVHQLR